MDMKKAVVMAKRVIADLYADENIDEVGLEEIELDTSTKIWNVTIGFRRPWRRAPSEEYKFKPLLLDLTAYKERWYKTVQIDDSDGHLVSVKDRFIRDAA